METFSALLALCAGNSPVTGEFPAQKPVTQSFDVFFDRRLNKQLSKQSWGWWFYTPSWSLWRHCNGGNFVGFVLQWGEFKPVVHSNWVLGVIPLQWRAETSQITDNATVVQELVLANFNLNAKAPHHRNPPVTGGLTSQRAGNAQSIPHQYIIVQSINNNMQNRILLWRADVFVGGEKPYSTLKPGKGKYNWRRRKCSGGSTG